MKKPKCDVCGKRTSAWGVDCDECKQHAVDMMRAASTPANLARIAGELRAAGQVGAAVLLEGAK